MSFNSAFWLRLYTFKKITVYHPTTQIRNTSVRIVKGTPFQNDPDTTEKKKGGTLQAKYNRNNKHLAQSPTSRTLYLSFPKKTSHYTTSPTFWGLGGLNARTKTNTANESRNQLTHYYTSKSAFRLPAAAVEACLEETHAGQMRLSSLSPSTSASPRIACSLPPHPPRHWRPWGAIGVRLRSTQGQPAAHGIVCLCCCSCGK